MLSWGSTILKWGRFQVGAQHMHGYIFKQLFSEVEFVISSEICVNSATEYTDFFSYEKMTTDLCNDELITSHQYTKTIQYTPGLIKYTMS